MIEVRSDGERLTVRGALDAAGAAEFLRVALAASGDVLIDASELEAIDGAGLTALVVARRSCRERGRAFIVTALAPDATRRLRAGRDLARLLDRADPVEPEAAPARPAPRSTPAVAARHRSFRFAGRLHR